MRILEKSLAISLVHVAAGFGVAYALTGQFAIALGVGLIVPMLNAVIFLGRALARRHHGGLLSA